MAKTTKLHFEIFQKECERWIEKFGLRGWDVSFAHKVGNKNHRAECTYAVVNRSITLGLNPDWGSEQITVSRIKKDAFHEVCEVVMCKTRNLAEYRFATQYEIDEAVHEVIRTLENVLFYELED